MISFIYQTLAKIGYTHPLHPTVTHLPVGLVIGTFLFMVLALIFKRDVLAQTARHCIVLALFGVPPTVLLGIMDWQHFYGGSLLFPIKMKLILAGVLLIFLIIAVVFGLLAKNSVKLIFTLYVLCLLSVVGLGYFGGELVYAKKETAAKVSEGLAAEGAVVFQQNCSACHLTDSTTTKIGPGLKGIFKRDKFPVSGLAVSEENFRKQLKTPFNKMPPFGHLSEENIETLVDYLNTL